MTHIFFCARERESIIVVKVILLAFEKASGLKIIFHKSLVISFNMGGTKGELFAYMMNGKKGAKFSLKGQSYYKICSNHLKRSIYVACIWYKWRGTTCTDITCLGP